MARKYDLIPGADSFYRIVVDGVLLGQVKKVYFRRSTHAWIIEPVDYTARTTKRITYGTRDAARGALINFTAFPHRKSLVEG